jgi:hypothetical protein
MAFYDVFQEVAGTSTSEDCVVRVRTGASEPVYSSIPINFQNREDSMDSGDTHSWHRIAYKALQGRLKWREKGWVLEDEGSDCSRCGAPDRVQRLDVQAFFSVGWNYLLVRLWIGVFCRVAK